MGLTIFSVFRFILLFLLIRARLHSQAINSFALPQYLSMQVDIQPTYLTLGMYFCVYGPFLSHSKSSHAPTLGSCRENLEKRQIEDDRRRK